MPMDRWKYYAIGHRDHTVLNPISDAAIDALVDLMALPDGARVLDVGCGKAELLLRCARRWRCRGVGVDLSPPFVEDARTRVEAAGLGDRIEIRLEDGARFEARGERFDAVCCLGASWIFGGHGGTLRALGEWTEPGGLVIAGEPFWRSAPSQGYLDAAGYAADVFGTHLSNVTTGLEQALRLLHTSVASEQDFDRYEGLQWNAIERHVARHPQDPDAAEMTSWLRRERDAYLRWGRQELGWAIYVFARDDENGAGS